MAHKDPVSSRTRHILRSEDVEEYEEHYERSRASLVSTFGYDIEKVEASLERYNKEIVNLEIRIKKIQLKRNSLIRHRNVVKGHLRKKAKNEEKIRLREEERARKERTSENRKRAAAQARRSRTAKNPARSIERGGSMANHAAAVLTIDALSKAFGLKTEVRDEIVKLETARLLRFVQWASQNPNNLKHLNEATALKHC